MYVCCVEVAVVLAQRATRGVACVTCTPHVICVSVVQDAFSVSILNPR